MAGTCCRVLRRESQGAQTHCGCCMRHTKGGCGEPSNAERNRCAAQGIRVHGLRLDEVNAERRSRW